MDIVSVASVISPCLVSLLEEGLSINESVVFIHIVGEVLDEQKEVSNQLLYDKTKLTVRTLTSIIKTLNNKGFIEISFVGKCRTIRCLRSDLLKYNIFQLINFMKI